MPWFFYTLAHKTGIDWSLAMIINQHSVLLAQSFDVEIESCDLTSISVLRMHLQQFHVIVALYEVELHFILFSTNI